MMLRQIDRDICSMTAARPLSSRSADTRQRLLRTALEAFSRHGFDAVGTRQIAEKAGANIAAISYHFGSKQALYLETAAFLADRMQEDLGPRLERLEAAIPGATADQCREMLSDLVGGFVEILLTGELGEDAPGFVLREQNRPTDAFGVLYEKLFKPLHRLTAQLVAGARGKDSPDKESQVVAHAVLGSAVAFRSARATLLKHWSKQSYSRADIRQIKSLVSALVAASIDYESHQGLLTAPEPRGPQA